MGSCCRVQGTRLTAVWWPTGMWVTGKPTRVRMYICVGLIHFVVQQKLTPHCKTIILQLKKKKSVDTSHHCWLSYILICLWISAVPFSRWKVKIPFLWPIFTRSPITELGGSLVIQRHSFCQSVLLFVLVSRNHSNQFPQTGWLTTGKRTEVQNQGMSRAALWRLLSCFWGLCCPLACSRIGAPLTSPLPSSLWGSPPGAAGRNTPYWI